MPAQARTVVTATTMVAVRVELKNLRCLPHGQRRLRRDLPSRQRRLWRGLLGSLPLVAHAGSLADLTLSHVPTQGHPDLAVASMRL